MTESSPGPRSGSRDNGLRCGGYVAAGDLDPRVADSLLDTLRSEGIAAYAAPTPATRGGYLEQRLPEQLTDRVFVDSEKTERALVLFEAEKADATPPAATSDPSSVTSPSAALDVDTAWRQLLTSLQTPTETTTWPSREDVTEGTAPASFDTLSVNPAGFGDGPGSGPRDYVVDDDPEDEHFQPPKPPPLPKLRPVTVGSIAAIIGGILIFITGIDGGDLWWLGVLGFLGGSGSLVWHMQDRPPTDTGSDDGAVV
jgi:hypothetical protein